MLTAVMLRIETQDEILRSINAERIVEVGPANILTNMMKRTHSMFYNQNDLACGITRRILGPQTDADEVYMRHTPQDDLQDGPDHGNIFDTTQAISTPVSAAPVSASQPSATQTTNVGSSAPANQLDDANLPVGRILWAIVASKLKKDTASLPAHATIGTLVGGEKGPCSHHSR